MENTSIFTNWTFWAVVISSIALILSQLPPVLFWFKRERIKLETYSRIYIDHKIGNPSIQMYLDIINVGGRLARIDKIVIDISRDSVRVKRLLAQTYLQNQSDKDAVLFNGINLRINEQWSHIINFSDFITRDNEKKLRLAIAEIREEINKKLAIPDNKGKVVEAEKNFVAPFIDIHNETFIWKPGDYRIDIIIETRNRKANLEESFRFTLFESDSKELENLKEKYKTGDGVFWDSSNTKGLIVPIEKLSK